MVHAKRLVAWTAAAIVLVWVLCLTMVALWVHGGGIEDASQSASGFISSLGALVGMLAMAILQLQVFLMARVPVFERGFGRDRIVHAHRLLGFWLFWLVIAHVVLLTAGFGMQFHNDPINQLKFFWNGFPGVNLAIISTIILFVTVIGMSLRRIRTKLHYSTWHLWHLIAYITSITLVPHVLLSGASFLGFSGARIIFWVLFAVTHLCVLVFRLGLPIYRSLRHDLRVESVTPDGSRGLEVRMIGRDLNKMHTRGGQFFIWRFLTKPGATAYHPFSLSLPPTDTHLQVAVRLVGDGTNRLKTIKPGTRVFFEGPYGNVTGDQRQGHRLLMFAAGAGVGPMISILGEQEWEPDDAILVTRDNVEEETMMVPAIQSLVADRGLAWKRLIGGFPAGGSLWMNPGPDGTAPDGAEAIRQWIDGPDASAKEIDETDVFLCGPPPWMKAVLADLKRAGIPSSHIHVEEFAF